MGVCTSSTRNHTRSKKTNPSPINSCQPNATPHLLLIFTSIDSTHNGNMKSRHYLLNIDDVPPDGVWRIASSSSTGRTTTTRTPKTRRPGGALWRVVGAVVLLGLTLWTSVGAFTPLSPRSLSSSTQQSSSSSSYLDSLGGGEGGEGRPSFFLNREDQEEGEASTTTATFLDDRYPKTSIPDEEYYGLTNPMANNWAGSKHETYGGYLHRLGKQQQQQQHQQKGPPGRWVPGRPVAGSEEEEEEASTL